MGVPAFFHWLCRKYPSVIVHCVEEKPVDVMGVKVPTDSSETNPNRIEFDNLYLDMNGIIHPCIHPEDGSPTPKNEDELMIAIFNCIDKIFNIVRPRKVLYMAIDGVAPRAKINQQRSRRFKNSKESFEKIKEIERIRAALLLQGVELPPEKKEEEHFDSNCILLPGTPFMSRLSECLHYYIHDRLNNDPGWKNIKVVLSDANVPGEGEHKMMDFIRRQRAQPDHDPNTQHLLYGADSDLIMLGLASHEPNFTIIREEFKPNQPKPCDICAQIGHEIEDCIGGVKGLEPDIKVFSDIQYIFVRLNVLKEYLKKELEMPNLPFEYEFERAVDDWIFMCFFVGNDFLPHLPSLEIREGAIERLVTLYKDCVYRTGGWLTDSGEVNLERVQLIMSELGKAEDEIFKTRQQRKLSFKAREKAKRRRSEGAYNERKPNWQLVRDNQFAPPTFDTRTTSVHNARNEIMMIRTAGMHTQVDSQLQTVSAKSALESMITPVDSEDQRRGVKRKAEDEDEESDDDQAHDEVRLWEDGYKDRYYDSKFDVSPSDYKFRNAVALHYVRGLCWVLKYYYQGCPSWSWYFPYHYAPFASDFVNISVLSTEFDSDTKPFKPLEQLMARFPAASSKHVPDLFAKLMTDPESPIIDFYPEDFKIDLNGERFAWRSVALIPFVDEKRLFKALAPLYSQLTDDEKKRNSLGDDRLYVSKGYHGHTLLNSLYMKDVSVEMETHVSFDGMAGTVLLSEICIDEGGSLGSPVKGLSVVSNNMVCTVRYRYPQYTKGFIFPARKLEGAKDPPTVLKPSDLTPQQNRQWRAQTGMVPATQRAYLDRPGHRMLNHHMPSYNIAPPPQNLDRRQNSYQQNSYNSRGGNYSSYLSQRGGEEGYGNSRGNYLGGYNQLNYNQQFIRGGFHSQQNRYQPYYRNQHQERRPPGPHRNRYQSRYNSRGGNYSSYQGRRGGGGGYGNSRGNYRGGYNQSNNNQQSSRGNYHSQQNRYQPYGRNQHQERRPPGPYT